MQEQIDELTRKLKQSTQQLTDTYEGIEAMKKGVGIRIADLENELAKAHRKIEQLKRNNRQ